MANGTNVAVNLTFTADTGKVRSQLQDLSQQLQKITSSTVSRDGLFKGFSSEINEATKAATQLQAQLQSCTNVNTGKLDLTKFTQQLQQGGVKLSDYANKLSALGPAGEKAFSALAQAIGNAEIPLRKSSGMLANFAANLKKVAQWQISSSVIHGFMSSLQSAYGYAQDLNSSLNDIRIVTGQSVSQMDAFAKKANEAAKALSTTTNNYAKASLIFYQQGLGDADVKARTDAVMKMVNVTKDSAQEVSSYMTAIWNNFDDGTKSLEHYADVMTALGAATASSTAEIAAGLEKFASIGDTIGLSYEYATSALATIVSQTRQSSEVVGNGLRTIFSRLQGLKLGETLDDGVNLNKYSQALSNVGVQILDAAGNMKTMDTILDELASKWTKLSKAQQTALAQTVGGVRQYTTLISLMDSWKAMEQNLKTAESSSGTLQAQQDIYAESWKAAADEVRAAWEGVWQVMVDDDFFISMLNGIEKVITGVHTLIDSMGGLKGVMSGMGLLMTSIFGKDMIASIDRFATSLQYKASGGDKAAIQTKIDANNAMMSMHRDSGRAGGAMAADGYEIQGKAQNLLIANAEKMNAAEQKNAQILLEQIQARTQLLVAAGEQAEKEEKIADKSKKTINNLLEMTSTKRMLAHSETGLSTDSLTKHLNTLTQLQNQYSTLAPAANSIGAILDSTFGKPSEKIQAITQHMSELEKKFADIGGAPEHVAQAMDKLNAALKSGDFKAITAAYGDLSKAMTQMEVDITKTENALLALKNIDIDKIARSPQQKAAYQELIKAIDDYIAAERRKATALQDGAQHQSEAEAALERYKQLLNNLKTTTKTFGEAVVGTMRGISSILMGLNSLSSIKDTLSDDSLSGWQKFSKVLLSVSMGLPMLISGFKALNLEALKTGAAGVAASIGQLAYAGASKVVTSVLGAQTAAQWGLNAAVAASPIGWFFGLLVGAAAILAGVTVGIVALYNALNAPTDAEKKLEDTKKAAEDLAEGYNKAKESYNALMQDVNKYESVRNQLNSCTAGTEEWRDATIELDSVIQGLLTKYPELAKYGKNIGEGLKELQDKAELHMKAAELGSSFAANDAAVQEYNIKRDDYGSRFEKLTFEQQQGMQYDLMSDQARFDDLIQAFKTKYNIREGELKNVPEKFVPKDIFNQDYDTAFQRSLSADMRATFDELWNQGEFEQAALNLVYNYLAQEVQDHEFYDTESASGYYGWLPFGVDDLIGTNDDGTLYLRSWEEFKDSIETEDRKGYGQTNWAYTEDLFNFYQNMGSLWAVDRINQMRPGEIGFEFNGYQGYINDTFNARYNMYGTDAIDLRRGYVEATADSMFRDSDETNDYIGEVAVNKMLQAVESKVNNEYAKLKGKDIIKKIYGNDASISEKDGKYTYTDASGVTTTMNESAWRHVLAWEDVYPERQKYYDEAKTSLQGIRSSPILQNYADNLNFDTATIADLQTLFGITDIESISAEKLSSALLNAFNYTDLDSLARDLGFDTNTPGADLTRDLVTLVETAYKAPEEAVKQLSADLSSKEGFSSNVQTWLEKSGSNLTFGQYKNTIDLLNTVNAKGGVESAVQLFGVMQKISPDSLPDFLTKLTSMDWNNLGSISDLSSLFKGTEFEAIWSTFASDFLKRTVTKGVGSLDMAAIVKAAAISGSKAGDTISKEDYDSLIDFTDIESHVMQTGDDEYTFIDSFVPKLTESIAQAETLHKVLQKNAQTWKDTPEEFVPWLKGAEGQELIKALGIESLTEADYQNADYMEFIKKSISDAFLADSSYNSDYAKSLVYSTAQNEDELKTMVQQIEGITLDQVAEGSPAAKALALIRNTAEETTESFNALTTSATTAISIMSGLSFGSALSAENYAKLMDQNTELADSFIQLADGSYRFIGTSKDVDTEIAKLIQSYKDIDKATIKSGFSSETNLATYADLTDTSSADYKALALAGYTPSEVQALMKSKDEKAIAAFEAAMTQVFETAKDPEQLAATMATSVKQLGSFVTKYGLDKNDVVKQGQYLMSQATTLTELKAMQDSLTKNDEAFKSLGITEADLSEGYVAGLLAIANGYASCKDEVQAYYAALATEDTTDDTTAKKALEDAITLEDLATKYNTTTEAIKAYKEIAGSSTSDEEAAKAIAKAKSIDTLNKSYADYVELGNKIKEDEKGEDNLSFLETDSESFESFIEAQKLLSSALGIDVTIAQTADLLQALDDETDFTNLLTDAEGPFNQTTASAKALWDALTHVETDPFQEATDALSQAATKLANDLEEAKTKAENAKTVFEEMINVLSDKDAKKSLSYLEGLQDLGLSSASSSSEIAKKYLDLQKEAIFKTKLELDNMFNKDGTAFADSNISLDSIINLTDTKQLSAKLREVFKDDNIANVAKEYFDTLYSETGSYMDGTAAETTKGLINYLKSHNQGLTEEWENFIAGFVDSLATAAQAQLQIEQEAAQETANAWIKAYQAINDAREGLAKGTSIIETLRGDTEALEAFITTALKSKKNAKEILDALASSSSTTDTDWVSSMLPDWSLKTQATGADITSQFLFEDGEYKGTDGKALVNYAEWAKSVDDWVDTAFTSVDQLTDDQKSTYGITDAMATNIEEVKTQIKKYYRGTGGSDEEPTEEYWNAQAAIIAAEGQHTWDELESKMTIAKNTRDTAMAKAEAEAKKNAGIAKAVQALIDRDEDSDETLKEIISSSGVTQEEFIALINEKYKDTGKQYTIDTVEEAIANEEIKLAEVLAMAESKRDTAYGEATTAATTYAEKFDDSDDLGALAGTQYEIEADNTVRTATLNQEAGAITGGQEAEKTVDAFTAQIDKLKMDAADLADEMSTLNSIDITKMPKDGTKAFTTLSNALSKAKKDMSTYTTEVQRAQMLADAQTQIMKDQSQVIKDQMSQYESKYSFNSSMTSADLLTITDQDKYQALQTYLGLIDEKEKIDAQADEIEAKRIENQTRAYDNQYTALENRLKNLQENAEKTKTKADTLSGAIGSGQLTDTQRRMFSEAELTQWDGASTAAERAAIAAKTFSSYATEASNAATEMNGIYGDIKQKVSSTGTTAISDKDTLLQKLKDENKLSEAAIGTMGKAWDRLIAKGDLDITMSDLVAEIGVMEEELKASSDAATDYAADQIVSTYTSLSTQSIEAAKAAADAWKTAFQEIAAARDKLLKGEDILSDVASNPEKLLNYFKNSTYSDMNTMVSDIISGKLTAKQLSTPMFVLDNFLAQYGLNMSSGEKGFGRSSVEDDKAMARTALAAQGLEVSDTAVEAYVKSYYKQILKANDKSLTDDQLTIQANELYKGTGDYNLFAKSSSDLVDSITLAFTQLQTALTQRTEAESALTGALKTDRAKYTQFNGKQVDAETLNKIDTAISNADQLKADGKKWSDLDAADRALLESYGITGFDDLSSQALGCANALAALSGEALSLAKETAQEHGFYKNADGVYETIVDSKGNVVTTGAFNADGTLKEGYKWSGNKNQGLTDQINTLQENADTATHDASDAGSIEALYGTDARLAGFDDAADQTNFIDYATQAGKLHDLTEIMGAYNVEAKEAEKIQRKLANTMKKREVALKKAIDQGEELVETANSETAAYDDRKDAIVALRSMYEDVLGPMDKVSDEFVKNTTNMKNFQKAAEGDEKALNELQASYVEALAGVDFGPELDALAAEVAAWDPGDLEVGATINDTDFLAKCAELVNKAGLTAEQASDALSAMGVDAKITPHQVTIGEGGSTTVEASGGIYVPKVSGDGSVSYEYAEAEGSYEIKGQPGETMTYYTIEGAKYNGKGVTGGGVGGRRGGGGGGGRREARRANHTTMKPERYHKIDNHIDNLTDAYERLNKQEDRAWGKDRINAMKQVSDNLKQQVQALRDKREEAEKYLAQDKAKAEEYGFNFDATTGDVTNYEDVLLGKKAEYNAAIDAYNAMSAEKQEEMDKKYKEMKDEDGVYYSGYEDYLQKTLIDGPQDALKTYEETMETWEQLGLDIAEKLDELYDGMVEAITYRMEFGMEITEEQLKLIEHRLKKIEDNAYQAAEAIAAEADKMGLHEQNYKLAYDQVDNLLKFHNTDWSVEDWMNGKISTQQLLDAGFTQTEIDAMKTSVEKMMESVEGMTESMVASYENMTKAFDEFNEDLERYSSAIEHAQSVTSSYRNILDLTGRSATGFTAELMRSFNADVVSQAKAGLTAAQEIQQSAEQQYQMALAKFQEAQTLYAEGSPEWLAAQTAFENAEDNLQEATENFMAAWESALQSVADAYRSNMETAIEDISKKMANGLAGGLEALDTRYNRMKTLNDNYVDDYEKIYQLTKLTRDLETQIDNTSNVRAQKELLKFQKEINGILQSDKKLSEYDIDYLQKKYDLKLAEIALEDAQNAKSQVTMRRDSEGNYNYVYTADEGAVAEAEAEYATKLYEMQKANDEYITELEASMISLEQEMLNAMLELDPSQFASQEEYMAALKEIEDFYLEQMNIYSEQLNNVISNNQSLWDNDMKWFNEHYGYKIADAKTFVTDWNETMLGQASGFATAEDFFGTFESGLSEASAAAVAAYKTFREDMDSINAQAGHPTETFAESVTTDLSTITSAAEQASTDIGHAVDTINTAINSIGKAITDTADVYKQQIGKMEQDTEKLALAVISLLTASGASISVSWTQGQAPNIQGAKEDAENDKHNDGVTPPVGLDTGGYTGAWGSEGKLAFLHQKELVLNAVDTENILTSVGILRQIANTIDLNALTSAGGFISLMSSGISGNKETLQQEVHIEASFPAVTDKNQIEDAFTDLVNLAAQYANRK